MFYPLKIKEIVKETSDAVSIQFELTEEVKPNFKFTPGQFLTLKADINGEDVRRSYSICSTPESGELKVAVKQISSGKFSSYAVQLLKAGDVLEVGVPAGRFTIETEASNAKNYVFVAAGSGITPILSMVKSVLSNEPSSKVSLFYGNKSIPETIFYQELSSLASTYAERFNLKLFFSQVQGDTPLTSGRITAEKFIQSCEQFGGFGAVDGLYLCGPKAMIDDVTEHLKVKYPEKAGVIHYELFTNIEPSNDTVEEDVADFDEAKVTATIDSIDYTFMVKAGKDVLSSALSAGIDLPYSCQGGVCGSCECQVSSGKVELLQNMVLSDDEVQEGQALACQAIPKSKEIKLDFDF